MTPIIIREIKTQLRSKAMSISTLVMCALLIIGGVVVRVLTNDDSTESSTIALAVDDHISIPAEANILGPTVKVTSIKLEQGTRDPAVAQFLKDSPAAISGVLTSGEKGFVLVSNEDGAKREAVRQLAQTVLLDDYLKNANLTSEQTQGLMASLHITVTDDGMNNGPFGANIDPDDFMVAIIVIVLMLFMVLTGVQLLSAGIVEEKSSRVVELLLAVVSPRQLLTAKVIGIGIVSALVTACYGTAAFIAVKISGFPLVINHWGALPKSLIWMVLGYLLYTLFIAGLASTTSRQEDLAPAIMPVIFLALIPFYLAMYLVPFQPDSVLTSVLSFIPFFSPFMMPMRDAIGMVGGLEYWSAVVVMMICVPLMAMLGGVIYERSVLRTGARVKLREIFPRKK